MRRYESFIEVDAPVERVFDMLADFEAYPRWMSVVRDVRRTGRRTSHWVAETALDMDVEWEAEVTIFEPDRRIVWRAFRGDVHADGEAVLSETERGTTVVRYVLGYDTPAGRTGGSAAQFFGDHPGRRLERDLEEFKRFAESYGRGERAGRRPDAPVGRRVRRRADDHVRRAEGFFEGGPGRRPGDTRQDYEGRAALRAVFERARHMTPERDDGAGHFDGERRGGGSGWAAGRGVDRLLEDPPSGRWRR